MSSEKLEKILEDSDSEHKETERKLAFERGLIDSLLENIPDLIYFKDTEGRVERVSKSYTELTGVDRGDIIGKKATELFTDEVGKRLLKEDKLVLKQGESIIGKEVKVTRPDGETRWVSTIKIPRYDQEGNVVGMLGVDRDITERKQMEEKLKKYSERLEEEVKERTKTIQELSTPVITVWDGVLSVPILGTVDSERAQQITEKLLEAVTEQEAQVAIIDVSGIATVDSAVANHLIRSAKAIRLIGAVPLLTGINPHIAQTISRLGIELEGLKTLATLKDGIQFAIKLMEE